MAHAYIGNTACQVTADKDLGDNWAVAVVPPPPAPSLVVKLQGDDKEKCILGALEILKNAGKIDRFEP